MTTPDDFDRELQLLFDHISEGIASDPDAIIPKLQPLSFYDPHLDHNLSLNRVVACSSLLTLLSRLTELRFKDIKGKNIKIPCDRFHGFPAPRFFKAFRNERLASDSRFVADNYGLTTGYFATAIASKFTFCINSPNWLSGVLWSQNRDSSENAALEEGYAPVLVLNAAVSNWIAEPLLQDLHEVQKRYPLLATWQILFPDSQSDGVLKGMDKLALQECFPLYKLGTAGFRMVHSMKHCRPGDAKMTAWGDSMDSFIASLDHLADPEPSIPIDHTQPKATLRRSLRNHTKRSLNEREHSKQPLSSKHQIPEVDWTQVTLPALPLGEIDSDSLPAALIQHAWTRAVEDDSSFIVISNGNFERIGFRHRSSGTLFLSELIQIKECRDPPYGKLHIGLFVAIIEDVLARTRQQLESEPTASRKRKFSTPTSSVPTKRHKTRSHAAKMAVVRKERKKAHEDVFKASKSRNVALVRFQTGVLNSATPSSFTRSGCFTKYKSTFSRDQCIVITVSKELGTGATGAAHQASLELTMQGGKTLSANDIVIKLAFNIEQRKRLRHEFTAYQRLISSNVEGIPMIFGLFQDMETRALALLMTHVGTSVVSLGPRTKQGHFNITAPQREAFVRILKDVHRAGIRHRDIRPENMIIHDDESVSIIDFDRADLEASEGSRERELRHLHELLEGRYYPPGDLPSLRTNPRSSSSLESSDDAYC